jgi:MoaA/NifB/PqqE/SkfB family radical SAM enzyme
MKAYGAEFFGTFWLILGRRGSSVHRRFEIKLNSTNPATAASWLPMNIPTLGPVPLVDRFRDVGYSRPIMDELGMANTLRLFLRGNRNMMTNKPLVVSFEVTSSCNANCGHCDKGGILETEQPMTPAQIGVHYRKLRPVAVQLSGGEPLLRGDIVDIAREIKERGGPPYLIVVSNGSLLDKKKYLALCDGGVNQFSISLDFPDERHDEFRQIPGLFKHLEKIIPELTAVGRGNVALNTTISNRNVGLLTQMSKLATSWGACMSFSAYSALRTDDPSYTVSSEADLKTLRSQLNEVIQMKKAGVDIRNPDSILEDTFRFFNESGFAGCMAGYRFLLITPEGYYRPCAHKPLKHRSQEELIEKFSKRNKCKGCYVAIRSYCDKSYLTLVKEQFLTRILPRS